MSLFPPKKKDIAEISLDLEIKGAEMKKKTCQVHHPLGFVFGRCLSPL